MASGLSQHKTNKTRKLLKEYENLFPAKTASIITDTLTGRGEKSLADVSSLLQQELQTGTSNNGSKTAEIRYHLREWKTLCENLAEVPVSHTKLRKYHPARSPETTTAANTQILATGRLSAYQLTPNEYATIVCQAPSSGNDDEITELKVIFTGSPTAFFKQSLAPNNWYRPQDVGK